MQAYDFVILFILAVATIWGARRGFAKQLATILSLVLGYFVAVSFREPVSQMIDAPDPWNKFAAMLGLFMVTSLTVWIGFRFVKGEIEESGLKGFDTQIGALFGLGKGLILSMLLTMFAAVMLGEAQRHNVLESFSGYNICRLLNRAQAIVPSEWSRVMQPYLEVIEEHQQHLAEDHQPGQLPHGQPYQPPIGNMPNQQNTFGNPGYAQQPQQSYGQQPSSQPTASQQGSGFGGLFGTRGNTSPTQNQQPSQQQYGQQYGTTPQQTTAEPIDPFRQIRQDVQRGVQQLGQQAQEAARQRIHQEVQQRFDQVMQPVQQTVQDAVGELNRFQTSANQPQQDPSQAQRQPYFGPR